jgi:hypothetical protein
MQKRRHYFGEHFLLTQGYEEHRFPSLCGLIITTRRLSKKNILTYPADSLVEKVSRD